MRKYPGLILLINQQKIFWLLNASIAGVLAFCIFHFGNIQFAGYDGSILINTAWQLHLKYRPYIDIVTGWPPILLIGSRIAFNLWGVHWQSLVLAAGIFSAATYLLQVAILQQYGLNPWINIMLSFTIQAITMVVISWWWYNQVTTVIGILFVSTALLMIRHPSNLFGQAIFVALTALLILSKPNIAGVLLLTVEFILIYFCEARFRIIGLTIFAITLSGIILVSFSIRPVDLLISYTNYGGQAISSQRIIDFLWKNNSTEATATMMAIIPGIMGLVFFVSKSASLYAGKQNLPVIVISILSIIIGIWGMMTNNEYNMSDASFILFGIMIITSLQQTKSLEEIRHNLITFLPITSMIFLTTLGLFYTAQRWRVSDVGYKNYYENVPLTELTAPPLFQGLKTGPRLIKVLDEMKSVLKESGYLGNPNAPVFFGPRVEFGYAAFGIYPHPGLPTWWEFFDQDGLGQTDIMVERFRQVNFQLCIFIHQNLPGLPENIVSYTYFPQSLISYLNENYDVSKHGELTIFLIKNKSFSLELNADK
jgi:hypothetical protein